jgi:hypothetical protein
LGKATQLPHRFDRLHPRSRRQVSDAAVAMFLCLRVVLSQFVETWSRKFDCFQYDQGRQQSESSSSVTLQALISQVLSSSLYMFSFLTHTAQALERHIRTAVRLNTLTLKMQDFCLLAYPALYLTLNPSPSRMLSVSAFPYPSHGRR